MNTGTPLDLTPFGSVLQGIGLLYWFLVALVLATVVTRAKSRWGKWVSAVVVLGIMVGPVAWDLWKKHEAQQKAKAQLNTAMTLFNERCKSAGEKVYRTVDNVEGIVWMKWRTEHFNQYDQFRLDDPYGHDCDGEGCIERLLRVTKGFELNPEEAKRHAQGYQFIETIDPQDGRHYRYIGVMKLGPTWTREKIEEYKEQNKKDIPSFSYRFSIERESIEQYTARYGITWEDISKREDREKWIAGGALKVIDLQKNEVIAERIGYMIDKAQGAAGGGRQPWSYARDNVCPSHYKNIEGQIAYFEKTWPFVRKILRPTKQDK